MNKIFILLLLSIKILYADSINITNNKINFNDFSLDFYHDKTKTLTIQTVQDANFSKKSNRSTLGIKKHTWIKLPLKNTTSQEKELYILYNNIHITMNITFYTLKNSKILETLHYDNIFDNVNKRDVPNRIGNMLFYKVKLLANEQKDIYIKIEVASQLFFDISISNFKHYSQQVISKNWFLIFLMGLLIAQALYYLFLYFLTPYKEYLYFSLFIFSVTLWSLYVYGGLAHYFDIYGRAGYRFNVLLFIAPIFTMLLFNTVFLTDKKFQFIKRLLNSFIIFFLIITILQALTDVGLVPFKTLTRFAPYILVVQIITLFSIGVYMYLKKVKLMGYFLIGYGVSVIGMFIANLFFLGLIPYNSFTFYAHNLSLFFESILFSTILAYRIKSLHLISLQKDNEIQLQNHKISSMREVVDNIEHQWKQPLSFINSSMVFIDRTLANNNIKNEAIENKLDEIENTTIYMSKTIKDFKSIYSKSGEKVLFDFKKLIKTTVGLIKPTFNDAKIEIKLNLDSDIKFKSFPNEFQQALLILLNNAKDAILYNKVDDGYVTINLTQKNETILIDILDNGRGIKKELLPNIFTPHITTKNYSQGSGLGLSIAKNIINTNMGGELSAKNITNGACFTIKFSTFVKKLSI